MLREPKSGSRDPGKQGRAGISLTSVAKGVGYLIIARLTPGCFLIIIKYVLCPLFFYYLEDTIL